MSTSKLGDGSLERLILGEIPLDATDQTIRRIGIIVEVDEEEDPGSLLAQASEILTLEAMDVLPHECLWLIFSGWCTSFLGHPDEPPAFHQRLQ